MNKTEMQNLINKQKVEIRQLKELVSKIKDAFKILEHLKLKYGVIHQEYGNCIRIPIGEVDFETLEFLHDNGFIRGILVKGDTFADWYKIL